MGGLCYDQNNNNLMNSNLSPTLQTNHSMFADNSRDKIPLEFNLKSNLNGSNYYSLIEQYEQRQLNSPATLLANNQPMIANQVSLELLSSLLAAQLNLINPYLLKQQQQPQQHQQFNQSTVNFLLPFQGLN